MARPIVTTAGQLAVNEALPESMRDYSGLKLDKAGISKLMSRLAVEHPEQYRDVSHRLNQLGNSTAYFSGANSFSLKSLARSQKSADLREQMEAELDQTLADDTLNDKQRSSQILSRIDKYRERQTAGIYDESLAEKNPLAMQILSGARGNKANLVSLRGGDLFYTDHRDRVIPVPVFNSYSEGLSPADFYAGSFGARKGVVDGKLSVMNSGYLSKMASQSTHRLVVTDEEDDTDREEHSALRGLPVAVDDMDSVGSLLARPTLGYPRNTVLTSAILNKLKTKGLEEILVRSPTVGGSRDGGVFARDVGYREYGRLPTRGEFVGLVAAQAAGEPLAQGGLCLFAESLVRMANGSTKRICEIKVGDWVVGCDHDGRLTHVRVLNVFQNGVKPCVRTQFTYRHETPIQVELISTEDHKLLAVDAEFRAVQTTVLEFGVAFQAIVPVRGVTGHLPEHQLMSGMPSHQSDLHEQPKLFVAFRDSTVPVGELETWDIEVEHPDHLFVLANGLVVGNSSKHSGGVAGAGTTASGFDYIQSLIQIPKTFNGMATHSQQDGSVSSVEVAPAGGFTVTINGEPHHVRPDNKLLVKRGDQLEAGDLLSDGIPSPAEFVKHKGIGEGRQQFVQAIRAAYKSGGFNIHRRNAELLGRGLIDHVRLDEDVEGFNQNDVVSYSTLERDWKPRSGALSTSPTAAKGMFLERPVLHYSLGTQLKPSVLAKLKKHGISEVTVNNEPLPFTPEMIRAQDNLHYDQDWMTRLYGSGLKSSLLDAAHKGLASDPDGTSFVPSIASSVDFGKSKYIQPASRPEAVSLGESTGRYPISVPHGTGGFGGSDILKPATWEPAKQADDTSSTFRDYDSDRFGQGGYKTNGLSSSPKPAAGSGFGGFSGMQPAANKAIGQIGQAAKQVGDAASSAGSWGGWGGIASTGALMAAPYVLPAAASWAYNSVFKAPATPPVTTPPAITASAPTAAVKTPTPPAAVKPPSAPAAVKPLSAPTVVKPPTAPAGNPTSYLQRAKNIIPKMPSYVTKPLGYANKALGYANRYGGVPLQAAVGAVEIATNQEGLQAQDAADNVAMNRGGMGYADMAGKNLTDFNGSSGMGRLMNATGGLLQSASNNFSQDFNANSRTNQATQAEVSRNSNQAAQHAARQQSPTAPTNLAELQADPDAMRLRNDSIRRRWLEIKQLNQKKSWLPWSP